MPSKKKQRTPILNSIKKCGLAPHTLMTLANLVILVTLMIFFGCNVDKNNSVQNTITKKNNKRIKKEHLINNDETNLNGD